MRLTQGQILRALHQGAIIRCEHISGSMGVARKVYRLSSNSKIVTTKMVETLLEDRLIRANQDGLPGIGESQSFVIWRASEGGA